MTTGTAGTPEIDTLPAGLVDFLLPLHREFEPRRQELLARRRAGLEASIAGNPPTYAPPSEATTGDWRIALPDWAQDQRNQITGPADNAKLLLAMTNSGAPGCMPDGEDSITTDWENVRRSHLNMVAAIRGTLTFTDPASGKVSQVNDSDQLWFFRPRGLHMSETRAIPGETLSASLFDLGEVFFSTIAERKAVAQDPAAQRRMCFYLPKVELAEDATWWSDLIAAMEEKAGIPVGQTKVMFLIESLPAGYNVEEILYNARRHVIGLNLGRWDYMASLIHYKLGDPGWLLPDRNTIPHDVPFFQNIRLRIVDVCHRHGALAIGGMTAIFPDRRNEELNTIAMQRLESDKKNEAVLGFDGAWTGHPDQTRVATEQFPAPNQLHVTHPDAPRQPDLLPNPSGIGQITVAGTRDAVRTVIEYRYGHLTHVGARLIRGYDFQGNLIGNFMEDLATDRIYRLMIAQRIRHAVPSAEGETHSRELVHRLFDEELAKLLEEHKDDPDAATVAANYTKARELSEQMILSGDFDPK